MLRNMLVSDCEMGSQMARNAEVILTHLPVAAASSPGGLRAERSCRCFDTPACSRNDDFPLVEPRFREKLSVCDLVTFRLNILDGRDISRDVRLVVGQADGQMSRSRRCRGCRGGRCLSMFVDVCRWLSLAVEGCRRLLSMERGRNRSSRSGGRDSSYLNKCSGGSRQGLQGFSMPILGSVGGCMLQIARPELKAAWEDATDRGFTQTTLHGWTREHLT